MGKQSAHPSSRISVFRRSGFFLKLFVSFACMSLLLAGLGVAYFAYSRAIIRDELLGKAQAALAASTEVLDIRLRVAKDAAMVFFQDETVKSMLMKRDSLLIEDERGRLRLTKLLPELLNLIGDIAVEIFAYADDENLFTNNGSYFFDSYFDRWRILERYDAAWWRELLLRRHTSTLFFAEPTTQRSSQITRNVTPLIMGNGSNGKYCVLSILISGERALETVRAGSILDGTGFVILGRENWAVASDLTPTAQASLLAHLQANGGEDRVRLAGAEYVLLRSVSLQSGWKCYGLIPVTSMHAYAAPFGGMVLILCAVLVMLMLCASLFISMRMTAPIHRIASGIAPSLVSGRQDDLDMIEKGIDDLKSQASTYRHEMMAYYRSYVNAEMVKCLHAGCVGDPDWLERIRDSIGGGRHLCACVAISGAIEAEEAHARLGLASGDVTAVNVLLMRSGLYLIIAGDDGQPALDDRLMQRVFRAFRPEETRVHIGLSGLYGELTSLTQSWDDAATALRRCDPARRFDAVNARNMRIRRVASDSMEEARRLYDCLDRRDAAQACQVAMRRIEQSIGDGISESGLQAILRDLCQSGVQYLRDRSVQPEQAVRNDAYLELLHGIPKNTGLESIARALGEYFAALMADLPAGEESGEPHLVKMVRAYVHQNYTQELSMERIAEDMGVSAKYVSRVFKESTGTPLPQFISAIRIDKACAMLIQTNINVEEVAERVGIVSRVTFTRLFNRQKGMSPSEYRRLYGGMRRSLEPLE